MRSAQTAWCSASGVTPAATQPRQRLLERGRLRRARADRAGSRGAGARDGAARRCWRGSGNARTRGRPAPPTRPAWRAARASSVVEALVPPPRRAPLGERADALDAFEERLPLRRRSVSPSSSPSSRTSSRRAGADRRLVLGLARDILTVDVHDHAISPAFRVVGIRAISSFLPCPHPTHSAIVTGRRPSDRLAAAEVDLRPVDRARRRLRSPALRARPHQRRLFPPDAEGRRRPATPALRAARRGADPVRLPRRRRAGRGRPAADRDGCAPGRLLLDHQPAHAGPRRRRAGSTSSASAWTRSSSSTTAARRAGSCATSAPATGSCAASTGIRVTPEFRDRERGDFAFMTQRSVVGAARRSERREIATMMRETKAAGGASSFVAGPGRDPHRRRRVSSAELIRRGYVDVAARRQRPGRARRRAGALRHVARRRSRGRRARLGRPPPPHARDQRHQPRRRHPRRGRVRRAHERRHGRVRPRRRRLSSSPAASATTARSPTRSPTSSRRRTATPRRWPTSGMVIVLSTMLHGIGVGNMLPAWVRSCASTSTRPSSRSSPTAARRRRSAS